MIIFDARRRQSARCLPKSRRWVVFLWRYSAGSGKPSCFFLMMMRRWRVVPRRCTTVFCVHTPPGKREIRWFPIFITYKYITLYFSVTIRWSINDRVHCINNITVHLCALTNTIRIIRLSSSPMPPVPINMTMYLTLDEGK